MSFILLGILNSAAGGAASQYFLSSLGSSSSDHGRGVGIDSAGNVYLAGNILSAGAGSADGYLIKLDPLGNIQWQRALGDATGQAFYDLTLDGSNNIYLTGYQSETSATATTFAKYDSAGNVLLQRKYRRSTSTGYYEEGRGIAVNAAGNIALNGYTFESATFRRAIYTHRLNSSANVTWAKFMRDASSTDGVDVAIDSSDNVYACGQEDTSRPYVVKYDPSSFIAWQRAFADANGGFFRKIQIAPSGNLYAAGDRNDGSNSRAYLVKMNSSGTVLWDRQLTDASSATFWTAMSISSTEDIYVAGYRGSNSYQILAKYDSSGNLQWQRKMTSSPSGKLYPHNLTIDANGDFYTALEYASAAGLNYLPGDGSLTGTYSLGSTSITYDVETMTSSAPGFSSTSPSISRNNSAPTATTTSLTSQSISLPQTLTNL